MINNEIDRNAFINNVECDINHTNSLKHLLNNTEDEYDIIPLSTYTDVNTLAERMSANNSTLSVLSLNAQSINANFDELKITIDQWNEIHTVSVICIQESWLDCNANIDLYQLNNYNLISKGMVAYLFICMPTLNTISWKILSGILRDGNSYS